MTPNAELSPADEARKAEAFAAADAANQRTPQPTDWGLEACEYVSAPGSAYPGFFWFESREALLDFANRHLVHLWGPNPASEHAHVQEELTVALAPFTSGGANISGLPDALNGMENQFVESEWAGPFDDLLHGTSDFAMELRERFRDAIYETEVEVEDGDEVDEGSIVEGDDSDYALNHPIEDGELDEFREFLLEDYSGA